ncbi:uncharacterized protein LOC126618357 [Malus sylvestris]|uniref:uncharacterized protein LOC126618357 n=1 Tax=Malus sylvestris TaxID=3752 RepID=UPI0021AC61B6|nr:uncharacterized protein LOC126618357 [Malus sylvestris]
MSNPTFLFGWWENPYSLFIPKPLNPRFQVAIRAQIREAKGQKTMSSLPAEQNGDSAPTGSSGGGGDSQSSLPTPFLTKTYQLHPSISRYYPKYRDIIDNIDNIAIF